MPAHSTAATTHFHLSPPPLPHTPLPVDMKDDRKEQGGWKGVGRGGGGRGGESVGGKRERERGTERERDRQTDRQRERESERKTGHKKYVEGLGCASAIC